MIHSFTCSGILPSQYIHLSQFAGLGTVGHAYIRQGTVSCSVYSGLYCIYSIVCASVYDRCGYIDIAHKEAEWSMTKAIEEAKSQPNYTTDGEVCETLNLKMSGNFK